MGPYETQLSATSQHSRQTGQPTKFTDVKQRQENQTCFKVVPATESDPLE